jgi:hypothetical protein
VHKAPKIEDFLENHPREAELAVHDFRQNSPGDGTPATEATSAYLSYDEKNLYVAFDCKDAVGNVLFTYLRHPGTALYLGYNNHYTDLTLRPGTPPFVAAQGVPNNTTSRLFFVKLSYLLRF